MIKTWTITMTLLCVLVTTSAQIALKVGVSNATLQASLTAGRPAEFFLGALLSPLVILGVALYVLSTALWLFVLARADVSFAYPFVSLGFVLIAAYAYLMLGEPMAPARLAGIALITGGVWLVARS